MNKKDVMLEIKNDEDRFLMMFGEMRGDLKSLLRSQEELNNRLTHIEVGVSERLSTIDARVKSLENMRVKVAGFATALGAVAALFGSKAGPAISETLKNLNGP